MADDVRLREGRTAGAIAVVDEDGVPVLRLCGEIDEAVVAAYDGVVPTGRPAAVIDASAVTFLDGRGLRFLLRSTQATSSGGVRPVLRRPARVVRRVIDLAGVRTCFTIGL